MRGIEDSRVGGLKVGVGSYRFISICSRRVWSEKACGVVLYEWKVLEYNMNGERHKYRLII